MIQMTEQRFSEEILPLHAAMYRMAVAMLGSSDEAADAVQDVIVKLWINRRALGSVDSVSGYCMVAMRNECASRLTRTRPALPLEAAIGCSKGDNPESSLENRDSLAYLRRAIESMPQTQARVMQLSAFAGLSNPEIAQALGISEVNVRSLLSRGRKKLRLLFSKHN